MVQLKQKSVDMFGVTFPYSFKASLDKSVTNTGAGSWSNRSDIAMSVGAVGKNLPEH